MSVKEKEMKSLQLVYLYYFLNQLMLISFILHTSLTYSFISMLFSLDLPKEIQNKNTYIVPLNNEEITKNASIEIRVN